MLNVNPSHPLAGTGKIPTGETFKYIATRELSSAGQRVIRENGYNRGAGVMAAIGGLGKCFNQGVG